MLIKKFPYFLAKFVNMLFFSVSKYLKQTFAKQMKNTKKIIKEPES